MQDDSSRHRSATSNLHDPLPTMQTTSKRKAPDDANPLVAAAKRAKKEAKSSASNKRKLVNGEELPGGLVIVRAPSARPPSAQSNRPLPSNTTTQLQRPSSPRPPSSQSHHTPLSPTGLSNPPYKKFRAGTSDTVSRTATRVNDRDVLSGARREPEIDEDVRRMDSEADDLRRYSRENMSSPADTLRPEFAFPATMSQQQEKQRQKQKQKQRRPGKTPHQERQGYPDQLSTSVRAARESLHQRRSSMGMRGKRISTSFETTGVIAQPHNSVSDASFYKHIDPDLPPAARVRQLLIWCSSRAMAKGIAEAATKSESSSKRKGKRSAKVAKEATELPQDTGPSLSEKALQVLQGVQGEVIRMLAERKVDTGVFGGPGGSKEKSVKENAQNVRNRQCKAKFTAQIERAEAEDHEWAETDRLYAARLAELAEMAQPSSSSSAKAKGKRRAEESESDARPRLDELPEKYHSGANMALKVVAEGLGEKTALARQLDRLQFELDGLHVFANSALQCTNAAESELDFRFALLSLSLAGRSAPHPGHTRSSTLTNFLPPQVTTDPRDLLRALAQVDSERPPALVGDSARRAVRELQRANEAGGGTGERRLTGVSPPVPTPRKPPGTPRKATPARSR